MSEHDGFHIMPMYYRMSTHAIPIRDGQTDIGVPIQDIIIQAMGDRDAKLASAREEIERLRAEAAGWRQNYRQGLTEAALTVLAGADACPIEDARHIFGHDMYNAIIDYRDAGGSENL